MLASCLISGLRCLKTLKCLEILLYLHVKMCSMCNPTDDSCHIFCIWWLLGSQCCGSQSEDVCVVTRGVHITEHRRRSAHVRTLGKTDRGCWGWAGNLQVAALASTAAHQPDRVRGTAAAHQDMCRGEQGMGCCDRQRCVGEGRNSF